MTRHSQPRPKNNASSAAKHDPDNEDRQPPALRIIGGHHRGRKLAYSGDVRTRPMKDRVREAVFNLVGYDATGKHAIDLFAGTGALGLEAISRGATRATFIEQHFPTAAIIRQNAATLGITEICQVDAANTFIWAKRQPDLGQNPWLVFSSPPYVFYTERQAEMLELIESLIDRSPPHSVFVVEADETFDYGLLPNPQQWDVRRYPPAIVGVWRKVPNDEAVGT